MYKKFKKIKWIDKEIVSKLKKNGVKRTGDLLTKITSIDDLENLADQAGISRVELKKIVSFSDLLRIKGVGKRIARELVFNCNIKNVQELAISSDSDIENYLELTEDIKKEKLKKVVNSAGHLTKEIDLRGYSKKKFIKIKSRRDNALKEENKYGKYVYLLIAIFIFILGYMFYALMYFQQINILDKIPYVFQENWITLTPASDLLMLLVEIRVSLLTNSALLIILCSLAVIVVVKVYGKMMYKWVITYFLDDGISRKTYLKLTNTSTTWIWVTIRIVQFSFFLWIANFILNEGLDYAESIKMGEKAFIPVLDIGFTELGLFIVLIIYTPFLLKIIDYKFKNPIDWNSIVKSSHYFFFLTSGYLIITLLTINLILPAAIDSSRVSTIQKYETETLVKAKAQFDTLKAEVYGLANDYSEHNMDSTIDMRYQIVNVKDEALHQMEAIVAHTDSVNRALFASLATGKEQNGAISSTISVSNTLVIYSMMLLFFLSYLFPLLITSFFKTIVYFSVFLTSILLEDQLMSLIDHYINIRQGTSEFYLLVIVALLFIKLISDKIEVFLKKENLIKIRSLKV